MNCIFETVRIIHLNTYAGNGGAGRASRRLNKALKAQGIDSVLAVNFLFRPDPEVENLSKGFFAKWITAAGIIIERILVKIFTKPVPIPFSFPVWGRDVSSGSLLKSADIIHLHWINHAFLRPEDIAALKQLNKPIVWTFHDINAFTGGCHVKYECDHYLRECGNCPVLKYSGDEDSSHRIWIRKARAYQNLKFTIIAPGSWMAETVRKSNMLGNHPVLHIPNTLDLKIFCPEDKTVARTALGLNRDRLILMSGFMPSRKDMHKGTAYLIEALEILQRDHRISSDKIELVVFGNRDEKNVPDFGVSTTFLGTINDDRKLSLCYSAADVFLAPSLEDNLPNTVMESLACGTPVVAFTTGGIPDMVKHKENGYLATYRSAADLAAGIVWVYEYPERGELNLNARKIVEEKFSEQIVAQQHIKLYETLLHTHDPA